MLEAAKTAGVLIPHYCYHPGLPVAGVCRMCLVEVEKIAEARAGVRHAVSLTARSITCIREGHARPGRASSRCC